MTENMFGELTMPARNMSTPRRVLMSARDLPESPLAADDTTDSNDAQQQRPAPDHAGGSNDGTQRDEQGTRAAGGYREQDYGGEPSHPPTEAHVA